MAWGNGYLYRTTAVVSSAQITGTLTNFPALVSLSSLNLKTVANSGAVQNTVTQTGGTPITIPADFLVTSDAAGSVPITGVEFESYSATAGTALIWVNVASAAVGSTIYIFYGNASVSTQQGTVASVWSANYVAVYHLAAVGANLSVVDSTGGFNGTNHNAASVTGMVDGGAGFNNSNGTFISTGFNQQLGNFTASVWFNSNSSNTGAQRLLDKNFSTGFWMGENANLANVASWGGGIEQGVAPFGTYLTFTGMNNWHMLSLSRSNTTLTLIGDGSNNVTATVSATAISANTLSIGLPGNPYSGSLDEIEISNVARSSAWVAAQYNNQDAPLTFWTLTYDQTSGGNLVCLIAGSASVAVNLTGIGALNAAIAASSTVTANLTGSGALSTGIAGSASVTASLTGSGFLSTIIAASATVNANLFGTGALLTGISGTASVVANLTNASGVSPISSTISGRARLLANLTAAAPYVPPPPPPFGYNYENPTPFPYPYQQNSSAFTYDYEKGTPFPYAYNKNTSD
jgi:hypothetical protein